MAQLMVTRTARHSCAPTKNTFDSIAQMGHAIDTRLSYVEFNKLAQNKADKRLQKTVHRYIFFFLSFTSLNLGGLVLMGNKLFSKTDEFSKGGLCDR